MLNVLRMKLAHCVKLNKNNSEARKRLMTPCLRLSINSGKHCKSDADNLADLQTQATGAQGQMEAIQAANQLASAQTNQLLQIRSLLVAQQNAAATLAQAQADKEAQQAAASKQLRNGDNISTSSLQSWSFPVRKKHETETLIHSCVNYHLLNYRM